MLFLYGLLSLKLKLNVILQIYAQAIHVFTSLHVLLKAMHTDVTVSLDTLDTVVNQVRRRNRLDLFNYVHPKMCSCNVGRSALDTAYCCMQSYSMHVFITAFVISPSRMTLSFINSIHYYRYNCKLVHCCHNIMQLKSG